MNLRAPLNAGEGPPSRAWDDPAQMLGVDEARLRILSAFDALDVVDVSLLDALDRVLAADIVAAENVPPFRNSAMDGYAVRAEDTTGSSTENPIVLDVVAEMPAGRPATTPLRSGQAVRIMTGAVLPDGADAVVRFEATDEIFQLPGQFESLPRTRTRGTVSIYHPIRQWDNVRHAGEDVAAGSAVISQGTLIRPAMIGVLASLNYSHVPVYRRPRIAILSTGDEVVEPGLPLQPGQIRNSNSYTLAAMTRQYGGGPMLLGIARDEAADITDWLYKARGADFILTSGGVSIGDFDVVKQVLQSEGQIDLWQVRIKPGKPLAFGRIGDIPLLGLPGNPVAAAVAFLQFARPAILKMQGFRDWSAPRIHARLLVEQENRGRRRHFVRGILERRDSEYVVTPVGSPGSGLLTSILRANCLIVISEHCDHAPANSIVDVELLDIGSFV